MTQSCDKCHEGEARAWSVHAARLKRGRLSPLIGGGPWLRPDLEGESEASGKREGTSKGSVADDKAVVQEGQGAVPHGPLRASRGFGFHLPAEEAMEARSQM